MTREYQADFYTLCDGVRDPAIRRRKAAKIRWALRQYAPKSLNSANCLDVGCSSGIMTADVSSLFGHTVGLDYDSVGLAAIDPADRSAVDFVQGDAMCLPFADATIDVVLCAQVYEHIPHDEFLFREIYRVLRPGGVVFFSGPNWLFPIEPHYFLPFLHWLPERWADACLRRTGLGDHYYERLRSLWGLHRMLQPFDIHDISRAALTTPYVTGAPWVRGIAARLPDMLWRILYPLLPNFNWILIKPVAGDKHRGHD